jgi:hypothetical protein
MEEKEKEILHTHIHTHTLTQAKRVKDRDYFELMTLYVLMGMPKPYNL